MNNNINSQRLARTFTELCEIDSPSQQEGQVAAYIKKVFTDLGADTIKEDNSGPATGSDCGNILVRYNSGGLNLEPVFFNCHMDTVQPGEGVRVKQNGDIFTSAGDTILGADDKSGIAAFIEVMRAMQEKNIPHGPVEFIFTTCEEIGLRGVKNLEFDDLQAKMGYALDTCGTDQVIIGAPAANRLIIEITGLSAHAGLAPEKGINAIQLAAEAIARLNLGRLDHESTANIGLISGGTATNIIPENAVVKGEVRSHSEAKLAIYTDEMRETFYEVVNNPANRNQSSVKPEVSITVNSEYPVMSLKKDDPVIKRVEKAAERLRRQLDYEVAGGGSDANIFTKQGRPCAIIGTGMQKVHTTDEFILLKDMSRTAELIFSILTG